MHEWLEQVFIVRSESYRHVLQEHLEERLQRAAAQIMALTPAPGHGKRQIRDEMPWSAPSQPS